MPTIWNKCVLISVNCASCVTRLRANPGVSLDELSMGMSHDFSVAIEEGRHGCELARRFSGKGRRNDRGVCLSSCETLSRGRSSRYTFIREQNAREFLVFGWQAEGRAGIAAYRRTRQRRAAAIFCGSFQCPAQRCCRTRRRASRYKRDVDFPPGERRAIRLSSSGARPCEAAAVVARAQFHLFNIAR